MTEPPEKIEPADFETIAPADPSLSADSTTQEQSTAQNRWVPPLLTALLIAGAVVFFWLPNAVDKPTLTPNASNNSGQNAASNPTGASDPERSPWAEAQAAKVRKEAQDVLGQLLDLQFELEEQGAPQWAAEAYAAALEIAALADESYRSKDFAASRDHYTAAVNAMAAIMNSGGEVLADALNRGQVALTELDADSAQEAFELALQIDPANEDAATGAVRAMNIEQVLALIQQADVLYQRGELQEARERLQQVRKLDPDYAAAVVTLTNIDDELTSARFNEAMSAGYEALNQGNFIQAEKQFRAASRLRPQAGEVQIALREAQDSQALRTIEAARSTAAAAESEEQWQAALDTYQDLLKKDNSLVFARVGAIRSGARAELDKALKATIEAPARLADERAYAEARTLFRDASTMSEKGPLLQRQITDLASILEDAIKPQRVDLLSDALTSVTLRRIAVLGTFTTHTLTLKPGTYVATGSRAGYRDVRKEFTVKAGSSIEPVTVQCTERI